MIAFRKKGYYGNTPQKRMEATAIRRSLREELSEFKKYVRDYYETEGEDKKDNLMWIKLKLKENTPFVAFKRWLIKDNQEYYKDLVEELKQEVQGR